MKTKASNLCRVGKLSRLAMMFAGRTGVRRTNVEHFKANMQAIVTAWSRLNLEGRSQTWSPRNVLPSIFVKGEMEYGDMVFRCTEIDDALWRGMLWKTC
jgi:hypothetical protein